MKQDHYRYELIPRLRGAAGMTRSELAARANITKMTLYRIESGKGCSFEVLCKIAEVFGVSWQSLLRTEGEVSENISLTLNISSCT